ncbi:MAG TPA: response regulator transcription factor [Anaerolineales bacterium]
MSEIHVLIADDHPIICTGIRKMIDPVPGMKVVGEAHTGQEALQMTEKLKPHVILLDMELPGMNGVEVIKQLREKKSSTKVLGLSAYDDREFIFQIISLGASGYLLKDEEPIKIIEAVQGAARGETGWISHKVAEKLAQVLQRNKDGGNDLTPREMDVLRHVVEGKTNGEIGVALGISEKTVEKHLEAIFRKMGVASRVEAAVVAVRESMV